jgi:hypothetical protein
MPHQKKSGPIWLSPRRYSEELYGRIITPIISGIRAKIARSGLPFLVLF